jgi:hypothetical protein
MSISFWSTQSFSRTIFVCSAIFFLTLFPGRVNAQGGWVELYDCTKLVAGSPSSDGLYGYNEKIGIEIEVWKYNCEEQINYGWYRISKYGSDDTNQPPLSSKVFVVAIEDASTELDTFQEQFSHDNSGAHLYLWVETGWCSSIDIEGSVGLPDYTTDEGGFYLFWSNLV